MAGSSHESKMVLSIDMNSELQESFSPQTPQRDEMGSVRWAQRGKKQVSWLPGTVDNEQLHKKRFEKEFFFSQDIWG